MTTAAPNRQLLLSLAVTFVSACRCSAPAPSAPAANVVAPAPTTSAAVQHPSVGVVPFVGPDGKPGWLGMAMADHLTTRLLVQSRIDPLTKVARYPLDVFSWRQTLSAARGEGIPPSEFGARAGDLRAALGADHLLTGTWTIEGTKVAVRWQLVGAAPAPAHDVACDVTGVTQASYDLAVEVLETLAPGFPKAASANEFQPLPPDAERQFGEALEIVSAQSMDPRARVVLSQPELDRAAKLLADVVAAAPSFARGWTERGAVASMRRDFAGAEEALQQASSQKDNAEPSTAIGIFYLYERKPDPAVALRTLEGVVATYPGSLQALGYLGELFLRDRRFEEALMVFTSYAQRIPASPWARLRRGVALARLGRHDEAIAEALAEVARYPSSVTTAGALASRQIDAGRLDDARATLAKALALHPDHPLLLTRLSYVELDAGHAAEALALAQKAVAAIGTARGETLGGYAHVDLAHALALTGRVDEAFVALAQARELGLGSDDLDRLARDPRLATFLKDPRAAPPKPTGVAPK